MYCTTEQMHHNNKHFFSSSLPLLWRRWRILYSQWEFTKTWKHISRPYRLGTTREGKKQLKGKNKWSWGKKRGWKCCEALRGGTGWENESAAASCLRTDVSIRLISLLSDYSSALYLPSPGDFMPPEQPEKLLLTAASMSSLSWIPDTWHR